MNSQLKSDSKYQCS